MAGVIAVLVMFGVILVWWFGVRPSYYRQRAELYRRQQAQHDAQLRHDAQVFRDGWSK